VFVVAFGRKFNVLGQITSIFEFALLELPLLVTISADTAVAENGVSVNKITRALVSRN
jgi:hypothetical protein